ncbi:MAG: FlgD immunoglobulin-like domain containing protein [Candidatus Eisenbacteria bacterium]
MNAHTPVIIALVVVVLAATATSSVAGISILEPLGPVCADSIYTFRFGIPYFVECTAVIEITFPSSWSIILGTDGITGEGWTFHAEGNVAEWSRDCFPYAGECWVDVRTAGPEGTQILGWRWVGIDFTGHWDYVTGEIPVSVRDGPPCAEPMYVEEAGSGSDLRSVVLVSPNPFADITRITIATRADQAELPIALSIHDTSGRLVRTLPMKMDDAGTYSAEWDATDLFGRKVPVGHYFVGCRMGNRMLTRHVFHLR